MKRLSIALNVGLILMLSIGVDPSDASSVHFPNSLAGNLASPASRKMNDLDTTYQNVYSLPFGVFGLAVSSSGDILTGSSGAQGLLMTSPNGETTQIFDQAVSAVAVSNDGYIYFSSGNMSDLPQSSQSLYRANPDGTGIEELANLGNQYATAIAVDPQGRVFFTESDGIYQLLNNQVLKLVGGFDNPRGLALLADGSFIVCNTSSVGRNGSIVRISQNGQFSTIVSGLYYPQGVAYNPVTGLIYVSASADEQVLAVDGNGNVEKVYSNLPNNNSVYISPTGDLMAAGWWGSVWVLDQLPLLMVTEPSAPTINTPTSPASGQLTWTWSPNSDGGSTITNYSWSGACSGSGNVTTVTCSGLTGGTNYTLRVTATNAVGTSAAGSRQGLALTVPGTPVATASPANGSLVATWPAPSSGGTSISGYTVTATANGRSYTCTTTTLTCIISGLTNATIYSVSVVATNAKGNSAPSTPVFIYPAPDTKFLAFAPTTVALIKTNVPVFVANAKPGSVVTVSAAGSSKTCTANAVGECTVNLNSAKAGGWVIVASYVDGKKTVAATTSYRINLANITVSTVQVAKGKSFTVKLASGAPRTQFKVVTSAGDTYITTLSGAGAGTITVPTKAKGPLTLTISDNGTVLRTTTVAVV